MRFEVKKEGKMRKFQEQAGGRWNETNGAKGGKLEMSRGGWRNEFEWLYKGEEEVEGNIRGRDKGRRKKMNIGEREKTGDEKENVIFFLSLYGNWIARRGAALFWAPRKENVQQEVSPFP
jgi:hypothetical protein